jgi:TonB family protein
VKLVFEPAIVKFIEPPKPVEAPPPPTIPDLVATRVDPGPEPDIQLNLPSDSRTAITTQPPETGTAVVEQAPPRVEPIHLVGKHQLPNTMDYYPATSRRLGVEGTTSISVCVDERGKRTGEPTVIESSGDARLDAGALAIARAGRYARSARGATFVPNCYGFNIVFQMQKP